VISFLFVHNGAIESHFARKNLLPTPHRNRSQRENFWVVSAVCALTFSSAVACTPDLGDPPAGNAHPVASLLAVGDTGEPWEMLPWLFEGQLAVGEAMQREHADSPIDALVLLGDNFYPDGLLAHELLARIVENVARPYCDFIDPSPELVALLDRVDRGCGKGKQPPPRLLAIIGNHDVLSPGSVDLQRNEVPRFVRNWDMPAEDSPVLRELPGGLSLILLVSEWPWGDEQSDELATALRNARGPWRVIVGHRPPIAGHPQFSGMVARASRESGRVVHAYLAGHVHGLAAIRGTESAPALTVIAGSGSHANLQEETEYRIEGADVMVEALGFVRVDAFAGPSHPRLSISLLEARPSAALAFLGTTTVARYEISLDGSVERVE
jgi:hypothetical protein